ncbi:GGDEF domain-containing protein [Marinobacterium lutimaris]|uniref:PAS domain S-box-containing protein/diguanylate cyclase (GGDEF) domain-containing protein n=1 Tax=Marinobacterium lutimaris TaxID=568106 RepID=A0A1H6C4M8_9GAMM|nr:sensor domain-containing diguanylate cyclase [Marinobacterium lutimaris]SEG67950.1 PAS domain S-box-containing protein/diguanylate cyclase (GGDEF) domain-containing protein [Marinobacterium lutimaris]
MDKNEQGLPSEFFYQMYRHISDAVYLIDPETSNIIDANAAGCAALGMSRQEVVSESAMTLNKDVLGLEQWNEISAEIQRKGSFLFMGRHRRKDGSDYPVEILTDCIEYEGRSVFVSVARDLSGFERHRDYLLENEHLRTLFLNESSDGLWDWNLEDSSLFLSPQWFRIMGYGPHEIENPTVETWSNAIHPDDVKRVMDAMESHLSGESARYEVKYRLRNRNGNFIWVHDRGLIAKRDENGEPMRVVGLVIDITESQRHAEELLHRARVDELTGLCNRRAGYELFEHHLMKSQQTGEPLQVAMFDLDRFKLLNDTYGHLDGDKAIQHFAGTLKSHLRSTDNLFRWGGEEFLLLCPGISVEEGTALITRLVAEVAARPFVSSGGEILSVTCSAGLASYPQDGLSIRELVSKADQGMYRAKKAGRNQVA